MLQWRQSQYFSPCADRGNQNVRAANLILLCQAPALPSARSVKGPRLERLRWALTGLGLALLVLLVLPSAQIKLGASQLNGLIGSYGGGYPGGGSWQSLPCDASGVLLPSPNYDQDNFCALTGTQTGSATTTYPPFMRAAAQNDPADYEWYLTAFSPAREIYFPYAAGPVPAVAYPGFDHKGINLLGDSWARNYATTNYGNVSGTYTVPDGSGGVVSGLINGTVKTAETGTVTAYFKWFYLDTASQPTTPPLGDAGPPDRMDVVLHARVSAWASVDYGTPTYGNPPLRSGLSAAASASDGLGDSVSPPAPAVTPTQPAAFSSQTLETPFLVHPVPSGNGAAAVSVTGSTSTNVSNAVGFGAYGPYPGAPGSGGYYQVTTGATSAGASSYVTARTQAVTALTADSTLESADWQTRKPRFFSGTNCTVTGSLTLPPPFTILHAQLSVNSVVVQEYDDKALTPLSADPRAVYTVGVNQASVSLPTTFDATVYPEGYALPLKLKVWNSKGVPFVFDLSAPVHLPQLTPYVIWTPDYTAAPVNGQLPQALAPSGTPMGGNSTLRVRVAYPPTVSGTLTELRLHFHADADATRDIIFPAVPLRLATTQNQAQDPYAAWAALCGDPDPALTRSAPCAYAEVPWNPSAGLRNGVYDLTSAVTVQSSDGVTRTWMSSPFTVDREDLLISSTVPVNPAPLLWDPDKINPATGTADPLTLSAAFHAAYKATGTMTLQVYTSDQTLVRMLTKAILTTDGTTDTGTPMTWDGNGEPINGQLGPKQPRGVFLFQWTINSLSATDVDCDKSPYLSVAYPAPDAILNGEDSTTDTMGLTYTLNSTDSPARSGYSGEVDVYDPNLTQTATTVLDSPSLTPGSHTVSITIPLMATDGDYVFVKSFRDNDADKDKAGRNRWTLQLNAPYKLGVITLITSGKYHIAWCRANHPVQLRTLVPSGGSQPHAPRVWVNSTPSKHTRAAVNGGLFNVTTTTFPNGGANSPADIRDFGEVGLSGSWQTYEPCPRWRCSFSMQGDLTNFPAFLEDRMEPVRSRAGNLTGIYKASASSESLPYGLSRVGLLVANSVAQPCLATYNWPVYQSSVQRTVIATSNRTGSKGQWIKGQDFFLITSSSDNWDGFANWLVDPTGFSAVSPEFARLGVQIQLAVMLDGGGSTEFGYQRTFSNPPVTDDGGTVSDGR